MLLAAAVLLLHVAGLVILLAFVPSHLDGTAFGLGAGLTAYTLGLRHAFDADHIGAIDATTRKLLNGRRRPLSIGFFFSLGHSTIVLALALLLALGVRGLGGAVEQGNSPLHQATDLIGPLISGTFLVLIGLLNLSTLSGIVSTLRPPRPGRQPSRQATHQTAAQGLMGRVFARATQAVKRPWQMYPVGCLFGLGFDTATEVSLLVLAGASANSGLPLYAVVCLPILFAAGMSLLDTIDGVMMCFAYSWAFFRPERKAVYNLTITALSVAIALLIGGVELLSVLARQLSLQGGIWSFAANFDLNTAGDLIVCLFVVTWIVAAATWRLSAKERPAGG